MRQVLTVLLRLHERARLLLPAAVSMSVCLSATFHPYRHPKYETFFTNGGKSYLVDRLAEVKLRGGTLLLVYPTKTGAQTFISRYLNPILEPVMRRFIFYHGLFPYLGDSMGTMEAVASTPRIRATLPPNIKPLPNPKRRAPRTIRPAQQFQPRLQRRRRIKPRTLGLARVLDPPGTTPAQGRSGPVSKDRWTHAVAHWAS